MKTRIIIDPVFGYREIRIDNSKQANVAGYMKAVHARPNAKFHNWMQTPTQAARLAANLATL